VTKLTKTGSKKRERERNLNLSEFSVDEGSTSKKLDKGSRITNSIQRPKYGTSFFEKKSIIEDGGFKEKSHSPFFSESFRKEIPLNPEINLEMDEEELYDNSSIIWINIAKTFSKQNLFLIKT
jgi:hypothetical protein